MTEHLQEIFNELPTDALLKENTRISDELIKLIQRRDMILKALEERYDPIM